MGSSTSVRLLTVLPTRRRSMFVLVLLAIAVASCGDGRTPVVVYSPHGRDLLVLAEGRFESANPDIDIRWLDMGSQDALDRIRSERANPQADVWFGGPSTLFRLAAGESLLTAYRPAWAAAIPARAHGPRDLYFAAYETPAVIAYNSTAVSKDDAPADWDDVLAPRWRGKVIIREPLASGTMRTIFGMIVERGIRASGDTAAGFRWLRRLDANTREYVFNPALLHQKLLRQEGVVTLWDLPDILVEAEKGSPFGYVLPPSGTPVIEDAIALVRGSRQTEAARRFIDWVGSPEAQLLAARQTYRLPARIDLAIDSLPAWVRRVRQELVAAEIDWELLSRRGSEWMDYWDRHVRGRGVGAVAR